jgi:hypothetical protein
VNADEAYAPSDPHLPAPFDPVAYRRRDVDERIFTRLEHYRAKRHQVRQTAEGWLDLVTTLMRR